VSRKDERETVRDIHMRREREYEIEREKEGESTSYTDVEGERVQDAEKIREITRYRPD
jgi:hypothetical protein